MPEAICAFCLRAKRFIQIPTNRVLCTTCQDYYKRDIYEIGRTLSPAEIAGTDHTSLGMNYIITQKLLERYPKSSDHWKEYLTVTEMLANVRYRNAINRRVNHRPGYIGEGRESYPTSNTETTHHPELMKAIVADIEKGKEDRLKTELARLTASPREKLKRFIV